MILWFAFIAKYNTYKCNLLTATYYNNKNNANVMGVFIISKILWKVMEMFNITHNLNN